MEYVIMQTFTISVKGRGWCGLDDAAFAG